MAINQREEGVVLMVGGVDRSTVGVYVGCAVFVAAFWTGIVMGLWKLTS